MKYFPLIDTRPSCADFLACVNDKRLEKVVTPQDADVILVGGGDGFMLKMMRQWHYLGKPFLGMNCGTLGFLLNPLQPERLFTTQMKDVEAIQIEKVCVKLILSDGRAQDGFYFNDCVLGGSVLDYYTFRTEICDEVLQINGTGLVVSTSLGSTGYALNLGQPLMPLRSILRGMCGIATAPFKYRFFEQQEVRVSYSGKSPLTVGLDGYNDMYERIQEIIITPSDEFVTLLFFCDQKFDEKRLFLAQEKLGK